MPVFGNNYTTCTTTPLNEEKHENQICINYNRATSAQVNKGQRSKAPNSCQREVLANYIRDFLRTNHMKTKITTVSLYLCFLSYLLNETSQDLLSFSSTESDFRFKFQMKNVPTNCHLSLSIQTFFIQLPE